ncbi:hypothetical protein ACRZPF_001509 [Enterobacter mori]
MSRTADMHAAFDDVTEPFFSPSASIVEKQEGYDVIENSTPFKRGDTLLICFSGDSSTHTGMVMR